MRDALCTRRSAVLVATGVALPFVLLTLGPTQAEAAAPRHTHQQILDAIWMVEASGRLAPPDGDGGRSIGPYQIQKAYWLDAVARRPDLGGTYADVRDMAYAARVIAAYMERWAPDAWQRRDAEVIARIHNGGPKGASKESTLKYWGRVKAVLEGEGDQTPLDTPAGD